MSRASDVAQRVGVQRAAGMSHLDRLAMLFSASDCQKRSDPAAPLERRVGPPSRRSTIVASAISRSLSTLYIERRPGIYFGGDSLGCSCRSIGKFQGTDNNQHPMDTDVIRDHIRQRAVLISKPFEARMCDW